jgi:multiple sugar transport system permease protein
MVSDERSLRQPFRLHFHWRTINSFVVYLGNALMAILFLAPWAWALAVSLLPIDMLYDYPPVLFHWPPLLENFKQVLQFDQGRFINCMRISAMVAASTSVCVVILSGFAGYAFARLKFLGKNVIFILILATMMFPFTAVLIPLFSLISKLKLLNNPINLVILYTTFQLPLCIFLFRNAFEAIPSALRDAALIDGCHELNVLGQIMIPLVKPAIATVIIYSLYHSWNEFTAALIYMTSEEKTTVPVVLSYMALSGRFGSRDNILMAGSVISFLPILILFMFFQRFFIHGLLSGSTRG